MSFRSGHRERLSARYLVGSDETESRSRRLDAEAM